MFNSDHYKKQSAKDQQTAKLMFQKERQTNFMKLNMKDKLKEGQIYLKNNLLLGKESLQQSQYCLVKLK